MCIHYYIYEDQFYSIGYFSHEQLTVTTTNIMDNFLFGCSQGNKGCSGGVMGLGRHPISFVQQTSSKYKKIFSYCLPSRSNRVCVRRQCHGRDCRNWGSLCDEGQEGFVQLSLQTRMIVTLPSLEIYNKEPQRLCMMLGVGGQGLVLLGWLVVLNKHAYFGYIVALKYLEGQQSNFTTDYVTSIESSVANV